MIENPTPTPRSKWLRHAVVALFLCQAASAAMPTVGAAEPATCAVNPAIRQFDFWLGDWTVTYPGTSGSSASTVSATLDSCAVLETWRGDHSHRGENLFAYSAEEKSWHGLFADNEGRVHVLNGKVAAGVAEFYGPSRGENGEAELNRVRVMRVSANEVRQTWEKSTDKGATWGTVFQGDYERGH
ncbi:MAG TPA: hypothetical protein VGV09_08530 [Steroidobacteraceae bacterium]|nr:hypothetical protein [Steroidobacteraceae bacterium]